VAPAIAPEIGSANIFLCGANISVQPEQKMVGGRGGSCIIGASFPE
jgi:hypothetical protein